MSTLTKLFVVLLIVCSLLLTAGVVVYVNQGEAYKVSLDESASKIRSLERQVSVAEKNAEAAQQRETDQLTNLNRTIGELQNQLTAANQTTSQARAETAQLRQRISVQEANLSATASALQLQAQNIDALQKRVEDTRTQADQVRAQNVELVAANSDYQRRLDTLEREVQYRDELIAQLRAQTAAAPTGAAAANGARQAPAGDASGIVTNVRTDGQIRYASISLGAADRIQVGNRLPIIDPQGARFLGYFVVESVQQNESFGRLEGPAVDQIRPDHIVKTRI